MKDGIDIQIYETDDGKCPYLEWESKLTRISRAKISVRLARCSLECLDAGEKNNPRFLPPSNLKV